MKTTPKHKLAIIRLRGSQEEMGRQHGELLRQVGGYREAMDFYPELPERMLLGGARRSPVGLAARLLKGGMLAALESSRPAAYRARTRAFVDALGLPQRYVRFFMVMDVFQNIVGFAGRLRLGPFARRAAAAAMPACSSLAVWGDASASGTLRHARNFDFPGIGVWDRAPAVVFCDPDEGIRYGFVTTRGADTPGVTAFNEAGLTLTAHTRFHRDVSLRGAAVVDIGHDIVRRAESLADAVRLVAERRVSSTWGLMVSSAREGRALVIETTAAGVRTVEPRADYLTCANRYRHRDLLDGEVAASAAWAVHSNARERRLAGLVGAARSRGGMNDRDLERALDDRVDPDAPDAARGAGAVVAQPCTVKSIIAEPEEGAIRVSVGEAPTSRGPYVRLPWQWDGPVEVIEVDEPAVAERVDRVERARALFAEANRISVTTHDDDAVMAAVEGAATLCPEDPAYRFLAGVWRYRQGWPASAEAHLEAALANEAVPYRRAQILLWGARAAEAVGKSDRARALRAELLSMEGEELSEHQRAARRDGERPFARRGSDIHINMVLTEAI
jgi:hypothetical protein